MKRLSNILRQEGLRPSPSRIALSKARPPKSQKLLGKALEALAAAHDALHDDVYSELAPASDLKKVKDLVSALERLTKTGSFNTESRNITSGAIPSLKGYAKWLADPRSPYVQPIADGGVLELMKLAKKVIKSIRGEVDLLGSEVDSIRSEAELINSYLPAIEAAYNSAVSSGGSDRNSALSLMNLLYKMTRELRGREERRQERIKSMDSMDSQLSIWSNNIVLLQWREMVMKGQEDQ